MYVSRWNRRRKKPLMIKDSSAPDDEKWDEPPSGGVASSSQPPKKEKMVGVRKTVIGLNQDRPEICLCLLCGMETGYFCFQCGTIVCADCRLTPKGKESMCSCALPTECLESSTVAAGMSSEQRRVLYEAVLNLEELNDVMTEIDKYCKIARDKFVRSNPDTDPSSLDDIRHHPVDSYTSSTEPPTLEEYKKIITPNTLTSVVQEHAIRHLSSLSPDMRTRKSLMDITKLSETGWQELNRRQNLLRAPTQIPPL